MYSYVFERHLSSILYKRGWGETQVSTFSAPPAPARARPAPPVPRPAPKLPSAAPTLDLLAGLR